MSKFAEISSLFAALASDLRTLDSTAGNEVDLSISDLNCSLNMSEVPRVRILDTALSLMCFRAPQVYDSMTEFTLKTIVTVLSSSIECKVLRVNKEQVLRVGGLISKSDCVSFMDWCADILGKLDGHKGDLCYSLLYNVFRVAALAPCFPRAIPSDSNFKMRFGDSSTSGFANLVDRLQTEASFQNGEIPFRLLLWHLDPMILKQDVAQILQEIIKRPFLSLRMEIYDRIEWRSKIICLVISPSMFIETRAFLHNWFLMTGLASVMELLSDIVGQVLDIISRPVWWGISMEVGSKLPFSHAYFPYEHHLLRILAGPVSQEYFQHLLYKISGSDCNTGGHLRTPSGKTARKISLVDHKSMWAMVMNFPGWFFFASAMIFWNNSPANSFFSESILGSVKACVIHHDEVTCHSRAANFIAWILDPMSESNQCLAVDYLTKISGLWSQSYSSLDKCNEITRVRKETGKPKLHDMDGITSRELDSRAVFLWLKEFRDMYIKIFGTEVGFSTSNTNGCSIHQNVLLRRIPLGILLLSPNHLNAEGCSLLLHYAATGTIQEFSSIQGSGQTHKRSKHNSHRSSATWIGQCTEEEAIAGCKTVFGITDVAESIFHSMLKTEEEGLNYVCQVKMKTCNYLLKCMKRLIQVELDEDGIQMQMDLLTRVVRWRHQGKDIFENNKDLDYVCDALNARTASL